jgi:hypothetical protein
MLKKRHAKVQNTVGLWSATAFFVLALSACTFSSGHTENRDFGRYMKLEMGTSDKHAVYQQFKQPIDVYATPNGTSWVFLSMDSKTHFSTFIPYVGLFTGGGVNTSYTSYFFFDNNDVLVDVKSNIEEDYVNMWEGAAVLTTEAISGRWSDAQDAVNSEMSALGYPYIIRSKAYLPPRVTETGTAVVHSEQQNSALEENSITAGKGDDASAQPSSPIRPEVTTIGEEVKCTESFSKTALEGTAENWILGCATGGSLEVRCFEDTCVLTNANPLSE